MGKESEYECKKEKKKSRKWESVGNSEGAIMERLVLSTLHKAGRGQ